MPSTMANKTMKKANQKLPFHPTSHLGRIGYWQKKLGSRSDLITPHLLAEHHGVENELKSAMSVEEVLEAA